MNKTKIGILFVLIGLVFLVIPLLILLAPLLILIGVIEFYMGRTEFNRHHQINIQFASVLFILFLLVLIIDIFFSITGGLNYSYAILSAIEYSIMSIVLLLMVKIFIKRIVLITFLIPIAASILFAILFEPVIILAIIFLITLYYLAYKEIGRYFIYLDDNRAIRHTKEIVIGEGQIRKVYDYYCPACLFQTNEKTKACPKCNEKGLVSSG